MKPTTTTSAQAFARMIEPLELLAGRRLGQPGRKRCIEAFERFPGGVEKVMQDVLRDGLERPVGAFLYRIDHGWHELEPLPTASQPNGDRPRAVDDCTGCGRRVPIDVSSLLCEACRDEGGSS